MSRYGPSPLHAIVTALVMSLLAPMVNYGAADVVGDGPYKLDYCVDGDTIRVFIDGESVAVRMVGIDTPELHHPNKPVQAFAKEAKEHLEQLIGKQKVYLQCIGKKDRYDRILAYVLLKDGTDLCLRQIADGFAYSFRKYPHDRLEEYNAAETAAREQQRGLWAEE